MAVDDLDDFLNRSERLLVFTGAGISTESGIADFRSPGGIWSRIKPIQFQDFLNDPEARLEDWRRRFYFKAQYEAAQPNAGHKAIASLAKKDRLLGVVTQNIDGLHQRAGLGDEAVVELHGSGLRASCLSCSTPMALNAIRDAIEETEEAPSCARCGGVVKADVISFGQPMPQQKMQRALQWVEQCDAVLVLGSSLVVEPAASIPRIAVQQGAPLAIINREPTPLDGLAKLVINDEIGPSLDLAMFHLG